MFVTVNLLSVFIFLSNSHFCWDIIIFNPTSKRLIYYIMLTYLTYLISKNGAPLPRLLIDFKNSKWLTYLCILLCICYCFSHKIGLLSVTWLSLLYKFTRFFIYFLFLSDEGPMLETLDYTIRIGSIHRPFYISICISTLPTQHTCNKCAGVYKGIPMVYYEGYIIHVLYQQYVYSVVF